MRINLAEIQLIPNPSHSEQVTEGKTLKKEKEGIKKLARQSVCVCLSVCVCVCHDKQTKEVIKKFVCSAVLSSCIKHEQRERDTMNSDRYRQPFRSRTKHMTSPSVQLWYSTITESDDRM